MIFSLPSNRTVRLSAVNNKEETANAQSQRQRDRESNLTKRNVGDLLTVASDVPDLLFFCVF